MRLWLPGRAAASLRRHLNLSLPLEPARVRELLEVSVSMLCDHVQAGEAVLRLEPPPDETWRGIFDDGLEEALGGRVRLTGDRLVVRTKPSMIHEGRLNGWWTNALGLRVRAANVGWRRQRDHPPPYESRADCARVGGALPWWHGLHEAGRLTKPPRSWSRRQPDDVTKPPRF
jgi:hypothetical protein